MGMAKQMGALQIRGTVGGICFYKMEGMYYARTKSSLSGERVKTDPAFEETMRYAKQMGQMGNKGTSDFRCKR